MLLNGKNSGAVDVRHCTWPPTAPEPPPQSAASLLEKAPTFARSASPACPGLEFHQALKRSHEAGTKGLSSSPIPIELFVHRSQAPPGSWHQGTAMEQGAPPWAPVSPCALINWTKSTPPYPVHSPTSQKHARNYFL